MDLLLGITTLVNWSLMALALWLGLFVVTRSPRSRISWLAGLTLWSATLYLAGRTTYPYTTGEGSALAVKVFTFGASLLPATLFHLCVLLLPERARLRNRLFVVLAYILSLLFILLGFSTDLLVFPRDGVPRVYTSGKGAGSLYPLLAVYILVATAISFSILYRLWQHERRPHLKRQLAILALSAIPILPAGTYIGLGTWLQLDIPTLPGDAVLAISFLFLGYAVAKFNALVEGRVIELDFIYTLLLILLMAGAYLLSSLVLFAGGGWPLVSGLILVALAIVSHFTYDYARSFLDRFFYHRQFRELRANLRSFAREAGTGRTLGGHLALLLQSFCLSFSTTQGFIALRRRPGLKYEEGRVSPFTLADWPTIPQASILHGSEVDLGLAGASAVVPLMVLGEDIGLLGLGEKTVGASYTGEDLELLADLGDQLAAIINIALSQEESLLEIQKMVGEYREREREVQLEVQALLAPEEEAEFPIPLGLLKDDFVELVDQALRHFQDFSYLGQHALANMQVVRTGLAGREEPVTHLDRGRALREVLLRAIERLRPGEKPPPHTPTREWYPYIVIHDAYVIGESNREIMSRLYISEGTFNRIRRRAILAVSRAVGEMEGGMIKVGQSVLYVKA